MKIDIEIALKSKAWPFIEAVAIAKRFENNPPEKGYVLFETGYGPSGLPHIGTFAEVFRTTLVRQAFERISDIPTKLFAFSDDMDGLRKVPDNLPNKQMIEENLGKPLTQIPDPFGTHKNFGEHMNNRLRQFLDSYGFDYEFKSSTECYKSGLFDEALLSVARNYDKIQSIMLPTLGEERRKTYSPFMPICPDTGKVLQAKIINVDAANNIIIYLNEQGKEVKTLITGGNCKLQWKADWGMRWAALDVDYEMHGKDLTPSAQLSSRICRAIGGTPPINYVYEMFLDEQGAKISKSKGNGISLEEWLKYGTPESLANFLYANPRKAKRLHFDVIPKNVDDYLTHLSKIQEQDIDDKYKNPVWHIHNSNTPSHEIPVSFALLLNLASVCNAEDKSVLWGFITRYAAGATPENNPYLDQLVGYAVTYYHDFVKPTKKYKTPDDNEKAAIEDLRSRLGNLPRDSSAEDIQILLFSVGKEHNYDNLREWFKTLYEVLLGQEQGPRMGSFIALYGIDETIELINRVG